MTEIIKKPFNVREIREEFPALRQEIYGKNLIYFDNGAKAYFQSGGTSTSPLLDWFIFRNGQAGTDLLNVDDSDNST